MNRQRHLQGLIAAGFTPFQSSGSVDLDTIPSLVEHLIANGCTGIYACGSTGEGPLLTSEERRAIAEAYIQSIAGRVPVFIQVGHNSVEESAALAAHAAENGADYISACAPGYFRPDTVSSLVDCMTEIAAAAPHTPFYYYHIPRFTGTDLDMVEFLRQCDTKLPSLAGIKYSDLKLFEFQACCEYRDGHYDMLWGCDEMLLAALATGAKAAIGSTYNFAAPVYHEVIRSFDVGNLKNAQAHMFRAVQLVNLLNGKHGPIHACMKAVMEMIGLPCGDIRLPMKPLSIEKKQALKTDLIDLGFFEWIDSTASSRQ